MTTLPPGFFRLSREIREMIYDLALEPVEFSNLYTAKTAYTPESCPLLYVHWMITEELQNRLYKNHAIVIPFQEPSEYVISNRTFAQHINKTTRRMKMHTDKIIVEIVQTKEARYPDNSFDRNGIRKYYGNFWRDHEAGADFPRRVVHELLWMKQHLPAVRTVKFVLWEGQWSMYPTAWMEPLQRLLDNWSELHIEVEINLFDYEDPDAFDGGMNFIQVWYHHCEPIERISFSANDFHWDDHEFGDYWGYRIEPRCFEDEYWEEMDPAERNAILEAGDAGDLVYLGEVECRPLLLRTYMDRAGEN
ncbi:hypothetical protein NCS57_00783200 [Fusarium keratoplasticum]|uniref:Uncharacterized protein n=1 Tax=Fusarium keratoplasticum TaxID=1328300 RepID=A0ACC0QZ83_9HYPO|nr:hypothetical protein NCS57_00783200 [Fusarium keratoplasticum]KAI8669673.1 hypothetical protein NCS57_00783200 [Fusarium keratoplasticum]